MPVSYTHLDVYKRQFLLWARGRQVSFWAHADKASALFLSLIHILGIQMMFSFMLVDDAKPLRLCKHCQKVFLGSRANSAFCSARCKNQYNVYKSRGKNKGQDGENDD